MCSSPTAIQHRSGPTARYRVHMFDRVCLEQDIEHRFTKPNHPWTNGQVERMNRTLKEATVRRYHYSTHQQLKGHLSAFLGIAYNFAVFAQRIEARTTFPLLQVPRAQVRMSLDDKAALSTMTCLDACMWGRSHGQSAAEVFRRGHSG